MLHYAAMSIQLPRTSSGHSQHQSSFNDQTIGGKSRTSHHLARCASARPGIQQDSSGAQLQKGTFPRPAEDSRYTLKLYLQTLSLSLSLFPSPSINVLLVCLSIRLYALILYVTICMPEKELCEIDITWWLPTDLERQTNQQLVHGEQLVQIKNFTSRTLSFLLYPLVSSSYIAWTLCCACSSRLSRKCI